MPHAAQIMRRPIVQANILRASAWSLRSTVMHSLTVNWSNRMAALVCEMRILFYDKLSHHVGDDVSSYPSSSDFSGCDIESFCCALLMIIA